MRVIMFLTLKKKKIDFPILPLYKYLDIILEKINDTLNIITALFLWDR